MKNNIVSLAKSPMHKNYVYKFYEHDNIVLSLLKKRGLRHAEA